MSNIGERIKDLRKEKNYSQQDLVKAIDNKISRLSIGNYETGKRTPDIDIVIELAKHFNVSTDYLLGVVDAKEPQNQILVTELGLTELSINFIKQIKDTNFIFPPHIKSRMTYIDILNLLFSNSKFKNLLHNIREATSKDNMTERNGNTISYSTSTFVVEAFEKRAVDTLSEIIEEIRLSEYFDCIEDIN